MRLLVQCDTCERKYDASSLESGSRFHCHCGEVVEVKTKNGHDETVCPNCATQISDVAQVCHHCGVSLHAESAAGEASSLHCPHCADGHAMVSRNVGKSRIPILECDHCTGLWLSNDVFQGLVDQAQDAAAIPDSNQSVPRNTIVQEPGWKYRKCPVCTELMARRNYGRRSGVIVDACVRATWYLV
ncbi:MAG: Zn-finger nucleic acid-binding protein [Pirellulaceae bacterium]|jgi:Zn-finger nucleic acid-binding protein